jgi:predicted GNAT superfamily acetyltransferase
VTDIRRLATPAAAARAAALFVAIWDSDLTPANLVRALDHTGGYAYGAYDGDALLAASVAFLGRDGEGLVLHSHVTGVAAAARGRGLGLAMKAHQREWALAGGIERVVWTFDPLVRRNAAFNIARLGALPVAYLADFYGPMDDGINRGDETDRLFVVWHLTAPPAGHAAGETRYVAVPEDVEALRRNDPAAARAWRYRVRDELGGALDAGWAVTGFDRERGYVLSR